MMSYWKNWKQTLEERLFITLIIFEPKFLACLHRKMIIKKRLG